MNRRSRRRRASRRHSSREPVDRSVPLRFLAKPRVILKPNSPRNVQKVHFQQITQSGECPVFNVSPPSEIAPPPRSARRHVHTARNSMRDTNQGTNYFSLNIPYCADFNAIKADIKKGVYVKKKCPSCNKQLMFSNVGISSCGHVFHLECLLNFRKNTNPRNHICPICGQLYHYTSAYAEDCYQDLAAVMIQKRFRGFKFRRHIGEYAVPGSIMHRKWVLSRAKNASVLLVDAIENQSDAVDAILASIDKELDWARTVMSAVEVQEKTIDWDSIRLKIDQRGCGTCPICFNDIHIDDCMVTSCEHCFHPNCLKHWLSVCENEEHASTCPVCRSPFQFRRLYEVGEREFFSKYPDARKDMSFIRQKLGLANIAS